MKIVEKSNCDEWHTETIRDEDARSHVQIQLIWPINHGSSLVPSQGQSFLSACVAFMALALPVFPAHLACDCVCLHNSRAEIHSNLFGKKIQFAVVMDCHFISFESHFEYVRFVLLL